VTEPTRATLFVIPALRCPVIPDTSVGNGRAGG
jgi:hypothetical protein